MQEQSTMIALNSKSTCKENKQSAMTRDAIERKKVALSLLASVQRDLEMKALYMIEERGLNDTIIFYNVYHNVGDQHTAIGRFIKAMSCITISCPVVNKQTPVGFPISLLLPNVSLLPPRSNVIH